MNTSMNSFGFDLDRFVGLERTIGQELQLQLPKFGYPTDLPMVDGNRVKVELSRNRSLRFVMLNDLIECHSVKNTNNCHSFRQEISVTGVNSHVL